MSIKMVFGLPGEGKTTFLTKCARMWLSGKRFLGIPPAERVFTSFYCPGCFKLEWENLGVYELQNANILIDEIMLYCDNRNWKDFSDNLKIFFSMARHWNVNVVMCSQSWRDCDLKIRNLVDKFYLIQKSKIFPSISFVKPIIKKFNVYHDSIIDTYELGAPLEWSIVYRPHYYQYFDTYAKHKQLPAKIYKSWDSDLKILRTETQDREEVQDRERAKLKMCIIEALDKEEGTSREEGQDKEEGTSREEGQDKEEGTSREEGQDKEEGTSREETQGREKTQDRNKKASGRTMRLPQNPTAGRKARLVQ